MQLNSRNKMISIIIPIYNSERYLPAMLDSILNQSFKDYELILVNDGSTDSSSQICHGYAKKHSGIRVFDRKNHGVASARNFGIGQAVGEFIWLMDSDDILLENALQVAVETQHRVDADVVVGGMEFYFAWEHRGENKVIDCERVFSGNDFAQHYSELFSRNYVSPLWNKLIRRNLILDRGLWLQKGLSMYEDYLFSMDVLIEAGIVACVPTVFYRYMLRGKESLSRAYKKNVTAMFRVLHEKIMEYRENLGKQSQAARISLDNLMVYLAYECIKNESKSPQGAARNVRNLLKDPDFRKAMRQFHGYGMRYRGVHLLMKYRCTWLLCLYIKFFA